MQKVNGIIQCRDHKEVALFLTRSESEQKTILLCRKCFADKRKDLILVEDAKNIFEEAKSGLIQERFQINKQNVEILKEVKENLIEFAEKINLSIDKIKSYIDSQIQVIEASSSQFQNLINEVTLEYIEVINQNTNEIMKQFINYKQLQQSLFNQMDNFAQNQFMNKCGQLIQKLEVDTQSESMNQFLDFGSFINQYSEKKTDWICDKHQQILIFVDLTQQKCIPNRIACFKCVPEYVVQYTELEEMKQIWQNYSEQALTFFNAYQSNAETKKNQIIQQLKEFKDTFLIILEQLIELIQKKTSLSNDDLQQHYQLLQKTWQKLNKEDLIKIANLLSQENRLAIVNQMIEQEFQSKNQTIEQLISTQMIELQNSIKSKFSLIISPILNPFTSEETVNFKTSNKESQSKVFQLQKQVFNLTMRVTYQTHLNQEIIKPIIVKPFSYELVFQVKVDSNCRSFDFNKQQTILICGQENGNIKVFEFNREQLKEIQSLKQHGKSVYCVYFMQNSSQFISGGDDEKIIIWSQNNQNQFELHQQLTGHTSRINCLIMTKQEDCIISCSSDKTIKFWDLKNQQWECNQTLSDHTSSVRCLALSFSQNKLASCGENKQLFIIQQNQNKVWNVIQKIQVQRYGYSLCFINDNLLTFQPEALNEMHIYEFEQRSNSFIKSQQEVQIKSSAECTGLFPQKFIQEKQILLNKNGKYVNLIKCNQNGQFETQQSIYNGSCCGLIGTISNGGDYLVTYESDSSEIKVRKYNLI